MEDSSSGARGRGRGRGRARGTRGTRGARGGARGASIAAASPAPDAEMSDAPPNEPSNEVPSSEPLTAASAATPVAPSPIEPTPSADTTAFSAINAPNFEPIRSASSASRGANPTRGAARGGRGGRFLPRAIRRSALDREAIANQEISKMEDQERQNARFSKLGRGGRGGGRRARGGPVNFGAVIRGGGGGFGSGIQQSASSSRNGGYSGFGAAGGFGSTGGGGGGGPGFTYRKGLKIEDGQFSNASRPTGPRMNTASFAEIVHHQLETDTKEKVIPLPMGIRRVDPKPADAEPKPEKEDEDEDKIKDNDRDDPMPISDDNSEIGDVFHNDNEVMGDDGQMWAGAQPAKRVKVEDEEFDEIDKLTQRLAMKSKASSKKQNALGDMDWEDRYHAEKMQTQRLLFGVDSDDEDENEDSGDSKDSKDVKEAKRKRKPLIQDGELYIFQFPPVMPPLHIIRPAPDDTANKGRVKDEPNDDVVMTDAPAKPKASLDLTIKNEMEEVVEEGGAAGFSSSKKKAKSGGVGRIEDQPTGYLGNLVVRKSGKISLDYGGMLFDVEMAIPISHQREAVLIVDEGDKTPDKDGYHGTAYGMGRIAGKFNAVPHWSAVKPWNVDAKELPLWGCDAAPEGTTTEDYAHLLKK